MDKQTFIQKLDACRSLADEILAEACQNMPDNVSFSNERETVLYFAEQALDAIDELRSYAYAAKITSENPFWRNSHDTRPES